MSSYELAGLSKEQRHIVCARMSVEHSLVVLNF